MNPFPLLAAASLLLATATAQTGSRTGNQTGHHTRTGIDVLAASDCEALREPERSELLPGRCFDWIDRLSVLRR